MTRQFNCTKCYTVLQEGEDKLCKGCEEICGAIKAPCKYSLGKWEGCTSPLPKREACPKVVEAYLVS